MAYLVLLATSCPTCHKQATHEVFNARNASQGKFCKKCAESFLKKLRKQEETDWKYPSG
jgi:ssDNA-binding Zn-finger/Zn-ribbon topoisomerase 1